MAIYHLTSKKREWNNCFIKSNQEMLLDLADFALQEQLQDNLMVTNFRVWYNGSYTMAAKPIKSLELDYTMIQFLLICVSPSTRTVFERKAWRERGSSCAFYKETRVFTYLKGRENHLKVFTNFCPGFSVILE